MSASKQEIVAFIEAEFPQTKCRVESVDEKGSTLSHEIGINELRPGARSLGQY